MLIYPLLLKPPIKDYLWGGTRLKTEYNYETDKEKAAEAWVLSCHKDGSDIVENGELAGKTLPEVLELWGDKAIGKNAAAFPYFPLLIKLIDAKDRLSVQVHSDDTYALKNEGELGKLKRSVWIITNWYRTQSYYDSGEWRATWRGEGGGVLFIPAHLVADVVEGAAKTHVKDDFGFEMICQGKFTTAQIDKNTWTEEMLDMLLDWIKNDPRGEEYRDLDWSKEYDLARNSDPNDTQTAL